MTEHMEWLTLSFVLANLTSELIKYVAVKIYTKIDQKIKSPLD